MSPSTTLASTRLLRRLVWQRVLDQGSVEFAELAARSDGFALVGTVILAEQERPLKIVYRLDCDAAWRFRSLTVEQGLDGEDRRLCLTRSDDGGWRRDGTPMPALAACSDPDLGCSPSTNALAIRRLALPVGGSGEITAAWLRFPGLTLEPAVQRYQRLDERRYRYHSLASGFTAELEVDELGLPLDYAGVWRCVAGWRPSAEG